MVSGKPCLVKAAYKGLNVEGHLSFGGSCKSFTFKFAALTNRKL